MTSICEKKSWQMSLYNFIILQKQSPKVLCKKGVLKHFAIFIGKHLCWSLFAGIQICNFLIRNTNTYVFLRILWTFKEHHFEKHLRATASYFMSMNRNHSSKVKNLNQWKSVSFQFRKLTWLQRVIQRNCTEI